LPWGHAPRPAQEQGSGYRLPKLDDTSAYVKLAHLQHNAIKSITVAIMEVPCCRGLDIMVRGAWKRMDIPLEVSLSASTENGRLMNDEPNEDITQALVNEHRLILRMITLLERNAAKTADGASSNWQFYIDGVDFIRSYADRFHHAKEEDILFEALVKNGMPRENSPIAAMLMEHDQGRAFVKPWKRRFWSAGRSERRGRSSPKCLGVCGALREHIAKRMTSSILLLSVLFLIS
jgi:hemerythrin-like domain-containing protein